MVINTSGKFLIFTVIIAGVIQHVRCFRPHSFSSVHVTNYVAKTVRKLNDRLPASSSSLLPYTSFSLLPNVHIARSSNRRSKGFLPHQAHSHSHDAESHASTPLVDGGKQAYPQQTPHSGRHFLPSHPQYKESNKWWRSHKFRRDSRQIKRKRFFEGWYYRLTLPEENVSFAFIISIEDPGRPKTDDLKMVGVQVMGPRDEYLVQTSPDDTKFWAWEGSQALGCTFDYTNNGAPNKDTSTAMTPEEWRERVRTGFQMLPQSLQGSIEGHDGSLGGVRENQGIPGTCSWDMTITPVSGWGGVDERQKSTAGWLASYPVFEPHWQVTMADGRASGTVTWKNETFNFQDQPFYAEKNWGGAFPIKWHWLQCNAFDNYPTLSLTAVGATRKLPLLGKTEDLGMVCIHYEGDMYEAVPWTGDMTWNVDPWGKWILRGRCTSGSRLFEAEVVATCDPGKVPGVVLRAPTQSEGLAYACRDSFLGDTTLTLCSLEWNKDKREYIRSGPPIIDRAFSKHGAVETGGDGGEPWLDSWKGTSRMRQPMKAMVKVPYMFERAKQRIGNIKRRIF